MPNQDLRLRRKLQRDEDPSHKNRFPILLGAVSAAIILPALTYTALHPSAVSSTVKQIAHHLPMQVKDIKIAVIASRSTPTPRPSPSPASSAPATPTPAPKTAAKPQSAAELARQAHLKRAHDLALALSGGHARKIASNGQQTSDISSTATNGISSGIAVTPAPQATSAKIASAPGPQAPVADATPVYAPEIVVDARFTREVHPDYPEVAKEQNAQGTAIVLATIGPNGNVLSAHIDQSTGNKLLDQAAISAARASGFEAPKVNGKPATETYRLVYTFAL